MKQINLRKRALSFLLSAAMLVGLLPTYALAADPQPVPTAQPQTETATVEVTYPDVNRTSAEIRYHKKGISADPVNLIFLVDVAVTGRESHEEFETMMRTNGLNYIYDYGVNSDTRLITYQNTVVDSGVVTSKNDLLDAIDKHGTPGQGVANEPAALKKAMEAVKAMDDGNPTVVFWVLGDRFGWKNESEIEEQVKALSNALGEEDALITWQLADKPNEMLTRYATHHGEAHTPDADIVAAHASPDTTIFRDEKRADLEQVVHDHYHDIDFTLHLDGNQSVVKAIKNGYYESDSAYIDMTAAPTADGKGIDVHLEHVCRQADIDFVLEVELNPEVYTQEKVIPGGSITAPADHSNGGLHTGIFDDGTLYGMTLTLPEVVIDRRQSKMTFQTGGAEGSAPEAIQQLVGTTVTIPGGEGLMNSGNNFGGWNVVSGPNKGTHYNTGQIIPMPSGDMVLEPAWGHVEVELELGNVDIADPPGNQLSDYAQTDGGYLYFNDVRTDSGETISIEDIISLSVIDQTVQYDKVVDAEDEHRVELTNVPDAVYARHVGMTDNDKVVAYLAPNQTEAGKYDMYIAGPGGVKASNNSSSLFKAESEYYPYKKYHFLRSISIDALDTSATTDMSSMFAYCSNLTSLDLGENFDTSNVTDMSNMFRGCSVLTSLDVSGFNTSKVTDMKSMFNGCSALTELNVSQFVTSNVTDMAGMFYECDSLTSLDVSNFDTSNVTDMSSMFCLSYDNQLATLTLGENFTTAQVTDMSYMFYDCRNLTSLDVSGFDTSAVENMEKMFYNCSDLKELNVSGFNTSNVTNMVGMFNGCHSLTSLDVSKFDTSDVTDMESMFSSCSSLMSLDVSKFDTSSVTDMNRMFANCSSLTSLDVSNFDTSKVTRMGSMFSYCSALTELTLGTSFDTSKVKDMGGMFQECSTLTGLDLSNFDTSNVTDMSWMFSDCSALEKLTLGDKFNISKVTTFRRMFFSCEALETISGSFKLGEKNAAQSMEEMFWNCEELGGVSFDTPENGANFDELSDMSTMFNYCTKIKCVDMGNWILPNTTNFERMFQSCNLLKNADLSWKGMRAQVGDLALTNMFSGVPNTAALEIGNDTSENTKAVMEAIAATFPGNVTVDGAPWGGADVISDLPQPELSPVEEPALPTEPEQPVETPEQPDNQPEQPAETPEQPTDEPGTDTETPEAPEETPGESEPQPEPVPEVPDTPEKPPVEEPEVTEPPAEKPAPDEEPADEPAPPVEDMPPEEAAPVPLAAMANVRSVGVSPLSTPLNSQNGDAAVQAAGDSSIIVHDEATPAGSSFTYRVRVKYAGSTGAQSGRIELAFPLPEKVAQSITETDIEVSDIEYSDGSSGGFKGGQIVKQPYLDESDPSSPVLRGTFEGLYTGNEIEITITCTNQSKTSGEDGYTYWDAIAYAQDSAGSAVSNVYRLWDKEDGTKPEPSNQHTLTYAFAGEVPPDAVLPHGGVYTSGNTVSIAARPTTSYDYYEFSGWVRSDTQATVTPGETGFSMPDNDLTLTGTWKIKEESAPKITVTYQYTSENDAQHVPNGAPELPGEIVSGDGEQHVHAQEIMVGDNHAIISILEHADNHIFGGWVPTLTIGGQEVTLGGPDRGGVYTGTHNEKTYTINTTGLLHTEQFRDATDVTVAFKGAWRPYTGTIQFDANGGEGTMQPMRNVTWDTKTQYLTQNQFTYPVAGYTFTGWATAPSGKVVKEDKALADGLIDKDGKTVTLYAVWKQTSFEVGYALSHVTSSNTGKTVARGGTYETTLTPESGYEMKSVSIQMGGMELASNSSIYNPATGKVSITDVSGDIIIRATAEAKTEPPTPVKHTITVSATGGTASPSGAVQVEDGKDQTITFTPNSGYELKSVTVDNAPASLTGNSYTFTNVTADHSIAVVYEKENSGGGSSGGGGGTTTDKYPVHVETDGSGTADSNKDKAASGETVTITTEGAVESITATADKTGKEIALTDKGNGKYTFKMPSSAVTVKVQFEQKPEIPSVADPDGTGVSSMLNTREHMAYMVGYETGNFGPANNITRAEVAQAFYRLLLDQSHSQSPSFPDVAADAWYHEAVVTLAAKGIITGYEDGTFRPEQPITRSEFAAIAARFAKASTDKALTFPDVPADAWYRGAVQTAVSYGWINGYEDGTFRPEQPIGRAETAAIINRMLARIADRSAVDGGAGTRFPDVPTGHWAFYDVVEASTEHDYTRGSNTAEESWSK